MPDPAQFAIVPLPDSPGPLRSALTVNAIATGSMSAVMQHIPDSREQRDLNLLIKRADAAYRVEQEIEARKALARDDLVQRLCDGISRMQRRLDSYITREELRRERDAQSRQIVDTYSIPADLQTSDPTPEPAHDTTRAADTEAVFPAQEGDYPQPSLYPDPRASDSGRTPDSTDRPPYPLPLDLATPASRPVVSAKELTHPQKPQEQPTAIDL
jgi:hypothetical protein